MSLFIEGIATLHNHIGADLDSSMSHSSGRNRALAFGLRPCHHLQIQHEEVIEILLTIGSSEDENLGLIHKHCSMAVSGRWRADTLWTLQPGHRHWIQCMQIPEDFPLGTTPAEDDNL